MIPSLITTRRYSLRQADHSSSVQPQAQAVAATDGVPALSYRWDFGDGTTASGAEVSHAFTRAADCNVKLTVDGVDGLPAENGVAVVVRGAVETTFHLLENRRYEGPGSK